MTTAKSAFRRIYLKGGTSLKSIPESNTEKSLFIADNPIYRGIYELFNY
jgi:hypothetical protein